MKQLEPLPPFQYAADVRDAIDRAASWHLDGWRDSANGRRRWSIWGRRNPYFFREDIDGQIMIDDGVKRIELSAKDSSSNTDNQTKGLPLQTTIYLTDSSPRGDEFIWERMANLLQPDPLRRSAQGIVEYHVPAHGGKPASVVTRIANQPRLQMPDRLRLDIYRYFDITGAIDLKRNQPFQGGSVAVLSQGVAAQDAQASIHLTERLLVDEKSHLPIQYVKYRPDNEPPLGASPTFLPGQKTDAQAQVMLTAHYNVDIPKAVALLPPAPNVPIVDMRKIAPSAIFQGLRFTKSGVAQTAAGDVCVSMALTYPGHIDTDPLLRPHFSVKIPNAVYATDDTGQFYLLTMKDGGDTPSHLTLYFTPQNPYQPGAPHPRRLSVYLPLSFQSRGASGSSGLSTGGLQSLPTFTVDLPNVPTMLPVPTETTTNYPGPDHYSLPQIDAVTRAQFYDSGGVNALVVGPGIVLAGAKRPSIMYNTGFRSPAHPTPISEEDHLQSAHWWQVAATAARSNADPEAARQYQSKADRATKQAHSHHAPKRLLPNTNIGSPTFP